MSETISTHSAPVQAPGSRLGSDDRSSLTWLMRIMMCALAVALAVPVSSAPPVSEANGGQGAAEGPAVSPVAAAFPLTQQAATNRLADRWRKLPASPLPALHIIAGVWTGRDVLVFGLQSTDSGGVRAAAAAYRPSTRTWRRLPTPPVPQGRGGVEGVEQAVWTGREMLIWGPGGLAYNVKTRTWRKLPSPPDGVSTGGPAGHVMVWTGKQMITWGGGCCGGVGNSGAAYTPATNSWRALPRSPLSARETTGAWTGKELVLVGGTNEDGKILRSAAAYNPSTRRWRALPLTPWAVAADSAVWNGSEVLLSGGRGQAGYAKPSRQGLAYKPATNRWRKLPAAQHPRSQSQAVWTGKRLLVWGGVTAAKGELIHAPHGESYSPRTNRWTPIAKSPLRGRWGQITVWTGRAMIIWGGWSLPGDLRYQTFRDGAAYTP